MSESLPGFPPSSWEDQMQRLDGINTGDDYIRKTCAHIAVSCVGMTNTEPVFYDACYPWDIEVYRKSMAKGQDKCALFALMILRGCGFALPEDGKGVAWRFGHCPPGKRAPLDPMSQLRMLNAWKPVNELAKPGCMNMVMRPGEDDSCHVFVVKERKGDKVISVDGGKKIAVSEKTRDVVQIGKDLCVYDKFMGNRVILGIIDPALMRRTVVRDYYLPIR